jgi:hypothetical protein
MPSRTFQEGDVVQRVKAGMSKVTGAAIDSGSVGTVCRVITPGRTYRVLYADFEICLVTFHDSLAPAPSGSVGPACHDDC